MCVCIYIYIYTYILYIYRGATNDIWGCITKGMNGHMLSYNQSIHGLGNIVCSTRADMSGTCQQTC